MASINYRFLSKEQKEVLKNDPIYKKLSQSELKKYSFRFSSDNKKNLLYKLFTKCFFYNNKVKETDHE